MLWISLLVATSIVGAKTSVIAKKKFHDSNKCDVFIYKHGNAINITTYPSWENIIDFGVSADENYLFVLHRADSQRSNMLSIYNIEKKRLIAKIKPGYGGEFRWITGNHIFHTWGCGTNCYSVVVYDSLLLSIPLPKMNLDDMSGYCTVSPGNKNAIFVSMHNDNYSVIDFTTMTEIETGRFRDAGAIQDVKYKNDSVVDIAIKSDEGDKIIQIRLSATKNHPLNDLREK